MIGAILGDIIGSRFEFHNHRSKDFELFTPECDFTDDTILTVATADAILNGRSYKEAYLDWGRRYPNPKGAYGASFSRWLWDPEPYNSFGNGAGMRVSPVGFAFVDKDCVLEEARKSAEVSHNHPEGIKGAQVIALSVNLLRRRGSKLALLEEFGGAYDLSRTIEEIRSTNTFNETCQVTVPQAIRCFIDSTSFEDAIRNAVSIGGDTDTIAAMTGALAEAYYGVPQELVNKLKDYLPEEMIRIVDRFCVRYETQPIPFWADPANGPIPDQYKYIERGSIFSI